MRKSIFVFFVPFMMGAAVQAWAQTEPTKPQIVNIVPDAVFAPSGFDSNDNIQLVLDGSLPDTCYKLGPAKARVDQAKRVIRIRSTAYRYAGRSCADITIPYVKTLDVGLANPGVYTIVVEDRAGSPLKTGRVDISPAASANPDEFMYAPVSEAFVRASEEGVGRVVVLRGSFPGTCMRMKKVQVNAGTNHVIEILPIVELMGQACHETMVPFSVPVRLPQVEAGKHLIHVRSLNGQSVNVIARF